MRSQRTYRALSKLRHRPGFTTPAVAVALLAILLGLALIVDRIWLETAKLELIIAAESASLAACAELVNDGVLVANNSTSLRLNNALEVAGSIAAQNVVGGVPVTLNTAPEGDVLFGNLVQQSEGIQFVESDANPTTVVVTARRTRSNNNPVAMFLSGVIGIPHGDVAARVEATVGNDVIGLRPMSGTPIPALPIAILDVDPAGIRIDTWNYAIETGQGVDQYSFDSATHTVVASSDGIPELVLQSQASGNSSNSPNVQLLDLGTGLSDSGTSRQFQTGVSVIDLQLLGGEIIVGQGVTASFNSSPEFTAAQLTGFQDLIGQTRICFLYSNSAVQSQTTSNVATCTEIVAVRVMSVSSQSDGSCAITIQPAVMTSRNLVLASEPPLSPIVTDPLTNQPAMNASDLLMNNVATQMVNTSSTTVTNAIPNPYVYKLRLSY